MSQKTLKTHLQFYSFICFFYTYWTTNFFSELMKKIHISKSFRAVENFTSTLIINSYINQRNSTNFTDFGKFKLICKILSRRMRSWNLYVKDYPRIFRFAFFYSGKFNQWKITYNLIAKVSFQILQSKLPFMLKD